MKNKSMTLAELIVVLALICILILSIYSVYLIFLSSINYDVERYKISSEVSYALADMKVRCLSASQISADSQFVYGAGESKETFAFTGERDIFTITPDDLTDDTDYSYTISGNGDLVLESASGKALVLVEGKYRPEVAFKYTDGDEPNFMTVTVTAHGTRNLGVEISSVTKTEGVRFWFIDVVK